MATFYIKGFSIILLLFPILLLVKGSIRINSLYCIFFWVWFYYAICVPFDILFNLTMPLQGSYVDLNNPDSHLEILKVSIQYTLCAIAFFFMYHFSPGSLSVNGNKWKKYKIVLPPFWLVAILVIGVCSVYISIYGESSRQERILMAIADWRLKLFHILTLLIQALSLIYVIQEPNRKKALAITLISFLFAFSSGGRSEVVMPALVYALRYELTLNRKQMMFIGVLGLFFLFLWKVAWSVIYFSHITNISGVVDASLIDIVKLKVLDGFSLSQLEGMGTYSTSVMLSLFENPGSLLGSSYIYTSLMMLYPRFLQSSPIETLSEHYGAQFHPDFVLAGGGVGFSGIGEAWLNFGILGPVIIGLILGMLIKYFDVKQRGVGFIIVSFIILRFFRSDAASIFKSYVVLLGGSFFVILASLFLLHAVSDLLRNNWMKTTKYLI